MWPLALAWCQYYGRLSSVKVCGRMEEALKLLPPRHPQSCEIWSKPLNRNHIGLYRVDVKGIL